MPLTRSGDQPVLFVLEDNKALSRNVDRIATRLGWHVIGARSLEGAKVLCRDQSLQITAALIDLMIPRDEDDLRFVDEMLDQRNQHCLTVTSRSMTGETPSRNEQKLVAMRAITVIDHQITERIAYEGGVTFLESSEAKGHFFGPSAARVAIFSARTQGTDDQQERDGLRTRIKNALGNRDPDMWFVKPVSALELEAWLNIQRYG